MKFKLIYLREGNRIEDFDTLDAISSEIEGIDWASGDYKVIDDEGNEYGADWVERPSESPSVLGIKVVTIGKYRLVKQTPYQ